MSGFVLNGLPYDVQKLAVVPDVLALGGKLPALRDRYRLTIIYHLMQPSSGCEDTVFMELCDRARRAVRST